MEHDNLTLTVAEVDYDDDFDFDEDEIFKLVFVIILSILGIVGNAIIIFAYAKKKRHTSTDVLIVAQAVTDFIATALAPSLILKTAFSSLVNNAVCVVSEVAENGSAFTSLFIMTAISVDRYLAVCRPFRRRLANRHALIISLGCVIASIAIMSPRAIFIKSININVKLEVNCEIHHGHQMRLFVAALFPVTFVGALLVTSVLYSKIYIFLRKQAKVHVSLVNANTEAVGKGEGEGIQLNGRVRTTASDADQVTVCSFMPGTCDGDLLCGAEASANQPHVELSTLTKVKMVPSGLKPEDTVTNVHVHHIQNDLTAFGQVTASAAATTSTARTETTTAANSTSHSNLASCNTTPESRQDDSNAIQALSLESKGVKPGCKSRAFTASNTVTIQNPVREAMATGSIMPATVSARRPRLRKENDMGRTTTKILLFITFFFYLTWIPQIFLTLFFQDNIDLLTSNSLALVVGGFAVLRSTNHVVNIFVYYYANQPFRKAVNKMFSQPCKIKAIVW